MTSDDRPPDRPDPATPPPATPATGGKPADPAPVERRARSDRRGGPDRRQKQVPVEVERRSGVDRRSVPDRRAGRRGGEYDLDADTLELIAAVTAFRERTGKTFPAWSDLVDLLRSLGWEKRPPA